MIVMMERMIKMRRSKRLASKKRILFNLLKQSSIKKPTQKQKTPKIFPLKKDSIMSTVLKKYMGLYHFKGLKRFNNKRSKRKRRLRKINF